MRNVFAFVTSGLVVLPLLTPVGGAFAEELGGNPASVGTCTTITIAGNEVTITGTFHNVTLEECKEKLPKTHEGSRASRLGAAIRFLKDGNPQTPGDVGNHVNRVSPEKKHVVKYYKDKGSVQCYSMGGVSVVAIGHWNCE